MAADRVGRKQSCKCNIIFPNEPFHKYKSADISCFKENLSAHATFT